LHHQNGPSWIVWKIFTSGNYSKFYIFKALREKQITGIAVGFGTVTVFIYLTEIAPGGRENVMPWKIHLAPCYVLSRLQQYHKIPNVAPHAAKKGRTKDILGQRSRKPARGDGKIRCKPARQLCAKNIPNLHSQPQPTAHSVLPFWNINLKHLRYGLHCKLLRCLRVLDRAHQCSASMLNWELLRHKLDIYYNII
jgi:hypothetical protein